MRGRGILVYMQDCVSFMGVDPGLTTGVAVITVPIESLLGNAAPEISEFSVHEIAGSINRQLGIMSDIAAKLLYPARRQVRPVIVVEDFDLDPVYHSRDKALLAPVRMIGAIEYAHGCNHFGYAAFVLQNRSLAKRDSTDDRLRSWGLYTRGSDHERDATRQAITMIRRVKNSRKTRLEVWGDAGAGASRIAA